jgi:hypothetical protein
MSRIHAHLAFSVALIGLLPAMPAAADTFFFSTGDPDGKVATAARPDTNEKFEIESADDFILGGTTAITSASFTGLIAGAPLTSIGDVRVEIYRVFPKDSDLGRTSGAPTFSTPQVPTRVNSPSDVAFAERDTASSNLSFSTTDLGSFTASNSVQPGGIHGAPGSDTGGDGAITGEEVKFDVTFTTPFTLAADHYFFAPQVEVTDAGGNFFWLSAPKPITSGAGPLPGDLQSWTRDEALDPDWLRVGTDIMGQGPFNAAFSVSGSVIPETSTWVMLLMGFGGLALARRRLSLSRANGLTS